MGVANQLLSEMISGKNPGGSPLSSRMELLFQRQIRSIPTAESPVGLWLPDGRPPGQTSKKRHECVVLGG